ncbi:MAG: hypothetical protein LBR23_04030 [Spirochaetaceae bacterium]|nr:hypothetical protein [Spirochaetaceae bacterium]
MAFTKEEQKLLELHRSLKTVQGKDALLVQAEALLKAQKPVGSRKNRLQKPFVNWRMP